MLDHWSDIGCAYNLVVSCQFTGSLDVAALDWSIGQVVARHESLRTHFASNDEGLWQIIQDRVAVPLTLVDLRSDPSPDAIRIPLKEAGARPFDLSKGPLLRPLLLRTGEDVFLFFLVVHHIVIDGWSHQVLLRELLSLYAAKVTETRADLPALSIQYADYALWQREQVKAGAIATQIAYWQHRLADIEPLDLPSHKTRPPVQTYRGSRHAVTFPGDLSRSVDHLCQSLGITSFAAYLAAFGLVLHRYSGQSDITIGVPCSGRKASELEDLIGLFLNVLVIRSQICPQDSIRDYLERVAMTCLDAYQNQDVPFQLLAREVNSKWSTSHHPFFQVMFSYAREQARSVSLPGVIVDAVSHEADEWVESSRFDLTLHIRDAGSSLNVAMDYRTDLYEAGMVRQMMGHFQRLVEQMVAGLDGLAMGAPLLTNEQRQQVVWDWNCTEAPYPHDTCLHQLADAQAEICPDAIAVVSGDRHLTYRALNRQANALAWQLRERGVGPEVRVGVCLERSLDLVIALLAVMKAGGVYVPIDPALPRERMALLVRDAGIETLLIGDDTPAGIPGCTAVRLKGELAEEGDHVPCSTMPSNAAYLIYTSGSTGGPKGVVNTHRGICNRLHWMQVTYGLASADVVLQKTPFGFDVSVWEFFWPLISGARLEILAPEKHKDSHYLAEVIAERQVTVIHFVPPMLDAFLASSVHVSLPSLRQVICSGEALSADLVRRFFAQHAVALDNLYGPTEAAIDVTYWPCTNDPAIRSVPIGRPISNVQAYVLDAWLQPVPCDVRGQLYIGGVALARGYHGRPGLTAERFIPDPFGTRPGERLYWTGDVASLRADSVIDFLGRVDNQVKIRGFRIELGEVREALCAHASVRDAVVMVTDLNGVGRCVVAYVVGDRDGQMELGGLWKHLRESLPEYMVPAFIIPVDCIPVTANGKVDARALPSPEVARDQRVGSAVGLRTATERVLASIWEDVLGVEHLDADSHFFELGGHSLVATQVVSRIEERCGVHVPLQSVFNSPRLSELAALVEESREANWQPTGLQAPARPGGARVSCVSFSQQRLLYLEQLDPGNAVYHVPMIVHIQGRLNTIALEQSLSEMIRRHEVLRTCYSADGDGTYTAEVLPPFPLRLQMVDVTDLGGFQKRAMVDRLISDHARQPFSLASDPPFRALLATESVDKHVLALVLHHVATDGWSVQIIAREIGALYRSCAAGEPSPLSDLSLQYGDYAVWQRAQLRGDREEHLLESWRQQLADLPTLNLNTDAPRGPFPSHRGDTVSFQVDRRLRDAIVELCHAEGGTPFMGLLGAYALLLSHHSGQLDIAIGTPTANRPRTEWEHLIGFFANTLVLRVVLGGNPTPRQLLRRIRGMAIQAFADQELPFDRLVEEMAPVRDTSRNPLFQVMFAFSPPWAGGDDWGDLHLAAEALDLHVAPFDLTLTLADTPQGLQGSLVYASDLFSHARVRSMAEHFTTLLQSMVDMPDVPIWELPVLGAAERHRLLDWGRSPVLSTEPSDVVCLFETQADRCPDAVAVVYGDQHITYRELRCLADRIAEQLTGAGIRPEEAIGICLPRGTEMVAGMLGIVKAGGAYVPLDPAHPHERIALILNASGIETIVTQSDLSRVFDPAPLRLILVDGHRPNAECRGVPPRSPSPDNCAYWIYTSGTTGTPKGVQVTHGALANCLQGFRRIVGIQAHDVMLALTTLSFDIATLEILLPLTAGARVVVSSRDEAIDGARLAQLMANQRVSIMQATPSTWRLLLDSGWQNGYLHTMLCGGEAMPGALSRQLLDQGGHVWNLYGPTETTIWSTARRVSPGTANGRAADVVEAIGGPIAGTQVHVLDAHGHPAPIGVQGILHIAGAGLARGYVGQPGLTAERFLPDPLAGVPGSRMYNTGDVCRHLRDGDIEFLGRLDGQVKIRGFRVEIEEIEGVLRALEGIRECVVVCAGENPSVGEALIAYLVADNHVPTLALRAHLHRLLPDYMIPSRFVQLQSIPRTPNGKLDRRSLAASEAPVQQTTLPDTPPRTATEQTIAEIWASVLGGERPSIHDLFFDIGGHSAAAARVVAGINRKLGVRLPLRSLYTDPLLQIAAYCDDRRRT